MNLDLCRFRLGFGEHFVTLKSHRQVFKVEATLFGWLGFAVNEVLITYLCFTVVHKWLMFQHQRSLRKLRW